MSKRLGISASINPTIAHLRNSRGLPSANIIPLLPACKSGSARARRRRARTNSTWPIKTFFIHCCRQKDMCYLHSTAFRSEQDLLPTSRSDSLTVADFLPFGYELLLPSLRVRADFAWLRSSEALPKEKATSSPTAQSTISAESICIHVYLASRAR